MAKKTTQPKTTTACQSVYPAMALDVSIQRFKDKTLPDIAGNASKSLAEKIIASMEVTLRTRPNFTFFDVLQQTRAFGITSNNVRPLFDKMTDYLVSVGKLERSESLYDGAESEMFIVHV